MVHAQYKSPVGILSAVACAILVHAWIVAFECPPHRAHYLFERDLPVEDFDHNKFEDQVAKWQTKNLLSMNIIPR